MRHRQGRVDPIEEQFAVRQAGQIVVHGVVQQPLLGDFCLGDVAERADDADHLAVGPDDRPRFQAEPEMASVAAQAEVLVDAAAPLFEHGVETGAEAIPLGWVQDVEPGRGRAFERAAGEAQLRLDLGTDMDMVGRDVPVENRVAAAGQGQRLALGVGDAAVAERAAGEGILHDRETDQHDDQHEAADQGRRDEIVGQCSGDGEGRADDPDQQQEPGRNQHDRAIVAMRGEIEHQDEADAGDRRKRNPRNARRDRRVIEGQAGEGGEKDQPGHRHMRGAHMPAVEVQIGEQKNQQRRREGGFDAGAPDAVGLAFRAEDPAPKSEVDADIGEHRPGQRGGGGKDHRALDDEDDGEKKRKQSGDADDDALIEGKARHFVFVGVRLPKIELRQVRGPQFRDIGDGRAGIEGQAEHVGVRAFVAFDRKALARGDRGNARSAEIGPDHAGADQPEMRRDQQSLDLLASIIGEREDDPVRACPFVPRTYLDAANDAVGTGRGRDEKTVSIGMIGFERLGQVDRLRLERHAHRFDGLGRRKPSRKRQEHNK